MNKDRMDQSVLLTNARAEFMRSFTEAMQRTLPRCIEDCFVKADDTYSSLEQGRLLDARTVLVEQRPNILQQMTNSMDHLLARSFKTTYNTYRPSANFNTDSLTLIDPTAFEGGLRLEEITSRFRSEAEDQLRDLNIRIALIFEQEVTNERENPFRPYLFSRCISTTVDGLSVNPSLVDTLVERIADNFLSFVPTIYSAVNTYLAQNGIAAQLQLKIRKSPTAPMPHGAGASETSQAEESANSEFNEEQENSAQPQKRSSQFEQFFSSALNRASNLISGAKPTQSQSQSQPQSETGENSGITQSQSRAAESDFHHAATGPFSWLKNGELVGDAIRGFFGGNAASRSVGGNAGANWDNSEHPQNSAFGNYTQDEVTQIPADSEYGSSSSESRASVGQGQLSGAIPDFQRTLTPSGAEMFDGRGGVRNLILEQRTALNELTSNINEKMTIDIVAMLFEFILRDTQVPAEIRAQLGRLQFLVLKLALKDTSLLTQKGHPARLLVNRIGSISLGLKQIDPTGVEITKEICRIVETLLQDESENPQIFSRMLDEFDVFIARELRAGNTGTESAIEGAEQVRNRTLRFAHTSAQLHEALLDLTIDPFLQNFFETVWVYVLELADREDVKRAHRLRLLVPDLLWSIIPKSNEEERAQLLALLPIILRTLKEGMASIQCEPAIQEELMNWLVDAHTKSMRLNHNNTQQKQASLSVIHQHFNNFFADPDLDNFTALENPDRSDVNKFLDDAIKELDIRVQLLDQVVVDELPLDSAEVNLPIRDLSVDPVMEQLKAGVSVEINLGGEPGQGTLNWIDPALTNLILTLEGQEQPSMLSVRMFRRMIAHGRVKFLETEPLFERAVQSLLKSADVGDVGKLA
ncbi:DUF1631 family protein [Undibacterium flavidum]|uniref:DUF1631 family protein n=1 Tax=Undibacterium flavidum TaxID=2762297 RepID=A0ABR6YH62_9BURK|nr:DUF1631 family protein [Undibacterium flavidum]MBC3875931.1 DUF1631 family protein [Undibacterium flavidum]